MTVSSAQRKMTVSSSEGSLAVSAWHSELSNALFKHLMCFII